MQDLAGADVERGELVGAGAIAALWTGAFAAIVWAALGGGEDALLPFSGRGCETEAGAEALMLAAIIATLGGTVAVIVWMVRRICAEGA